MSEISLHRRLVKMLNSEGREWHTIPVVTAGSGTLQLEELILEGQFTVRAEGSLLVDSKASLSQDLFASRRPDLAIVSKSSGQPRILVQVMEQAVPSTHKELDASQFVRDLLFLVAATDRRPYGIPDIRRGVLVAAPHAWFQDKRLSREWDYTVNQYGSLAETFDITLGAISLDE